MNLNGKTIQFKLLKLFSCGGKTAVKAIKQTHVFLPILLLILLILTACNNGTGEVSELSVNSPNTAETDYCTVNGGVVETRYPFYGTNADDPLRLSGSLDVCTFTADDDSRIIVSLETIYTEQPTLAALAYRAKTPIEDGGAPSANPSSLYCTQIGGTDSFGGVNASGGGWALEDGSDVISLCVFPDLSVIDSWGITYYSDGSIRGADLNNLLRFTQ